MIAWHHVYETNSGQHIWNGGENNSSTIEIDSKPNLVVVRIG